MKIAFLFSFLLSLSSCASLSETVRTSTTNQPVQVSNLDRFTPTTSTVVLCDDSDSYAVDVVDDEARQARNVVLLVAGKPKNVVQLPNGTEINGYALNWAKKTEDGLEISVEYGSRIYFDKRFLFECRNGEFHLTRIKVESFDKQKPDVWTNKEVKVKPSIPLADFKIKNYLNGR